MKRLIGAVCGILLLGPFVVGAQVPARDAGAITILKPARVFDGETMHEGWAVRVRGERIDMAGPAASVTAPAGATVVDMPGTTLMPGLVEPLYR